MLTSLKSYPRIMWIISIAMAIAAIGETFLWPLTTSYIHHELGMSLTVATTVLLLQYSASLIGNVTGGMLFDRWSGRKTLLLAVISSIILLVLMALQRDFKTYVVLLVLLGLCNGMYWPLLRALGATLWPEGGRRAMNMVYVANNVGVAIGATLGGLLASQSYTLAFFGNAMSYLLFLLIFVVFIKESHFPKREPKTAKTKQGKSAAVTPATSFRTWTTLGLISTGLTLLVITYIQWQTTISTYVQVLGISLPAYSFLWTLNGLVIVLGQPLLSWTISRFNWSVKAQIVIGALIFALSWVIISSSTAYIGFVLGMIVITIGEMLVWPGVPTVAAELAPKGREGLFQGIAFSGQSIGRMFGPLTGGFLYEHYSPQGMLLFMTVVSLLALFCFLSYRQAKQAPILTQEKTTLA